jgi:hypothetical protein
MKIILTHEESENLFLDAMCNALGYISGYGLELYFDNTEYKKYRKEGMCYEDVLLEILRNGGKLTLIDNECEGEYTKSITIQDVHDKVQDTPIKHLMDAINEHGDADTSDVILQSVFYGEVIFG